MKTSHTLIAAVLAAAVFGGNALAATVDQSATTAKSENWLTIPAIYDKMTAAGYNDINEIDRERDGYEVKARNADGERVKLLVDPVNGEVLDVKAKKHKSDKRRSDSADTMRDRDSDALPNDAK